MAAAAAAVALLFAWDAGGEDGAADDGARETDRVTPVSAVPVETGALTERGSFPGELAADAADVATQVAGELRAVHVRIGDEVTAGQELARVDVAELAEQQGESRAEAQAAAATETETTVELRAAERELERARELFEREIISQQELDNRRDQVASLEARLDVSRAQHARAKARVDVLAERIGNGRVRAPFDGVVTRRLHDPGNFVEAGATIVRVVARAPLRVQFEVPEQRVGRFGAGATFVVKAPPTGDREVEGRVTGTGAEVERDKRVVRVEGTLADPLSSWLPGMYADVVAALRTLEGATIVPDRAIVSRLRQGGEVQLGVFQPVDATARWVPVEVVARASERAAVEGEVDEGGEVLVAGHTDLSDGSRIDVAEGEL